MALKPLVLVIEDDAALAALLEYNLQQADYAVLIARSGDEGLRRAEQDRPALVIVDWMLPVVSGVSICRQLRKGEATRAIPIILLTARSQEHDRIQGLEAGADDYVSKPFSPGELLARVRALLRRASGSLGHEPLLRYGGLTMNTTTHTVEREGEPVHLGPTEYRLLKHFLRNAEKVFSREQLLDAVWGGNINVEERTVDVHIRRLRKAINLDDRFPDIIRTIRAAGYSLDAKGQ